MSRWLTLAVLASLAAVPACTGGGESAPPTTELPQVTTTVPPLPSDGVLSIGVLVPLSGPGAALGESLAAGAQYAVDMINGAGGVNGLSVRLTIEDEGADAGQGRQAVAELLERDVDAIVGPTSSRVALSVLGEIVRAGVVACSPSATAIALSEFPDDGLFFRTIPSDALEAIAIARVVDETGQQSVSIAASDDRFGRNLAAAVTAALQRRNVSNVRTINYDPGDDDLSQEAEDAVTEAPVVVVIGDAESGARMVTEARMAAPTAVVVVNDALRQAEFPTSADPSDPASPDSLRGLSPVAVPTAPWFTEPLREEYPDIVPNFSAHAYDCVNLLALASELAGSDEADAIAPLIPAVSRNGANCSDFQTCAERLRELRNIDYNGATGIVDLDANGDVERGEFERFGFDEDGRDVGGDRFTVVAGF